MTTSERSGVVSGADAEEPDEQVYDEIDTRRTLRGIAAVTVSVVAIAFSAFQLWIAARGFVFEFTVPGLETVRIGALAQLQIRAIHVNFALVLAFLLFPGSTGTGAITGRLAAIPPAVRSRFGDGPVTAVVERAHDGVRWAFVDASSTRITPSDLALIALSTLPTIYYVTRYDEVTNVVRIRGLGGAATLGDVYPWLAPLEVGPFATYAFAYLMGVLAILLVLEATRRALGLLLTVLVSVFLLYAKYGYLLPRDAPGIGMFATSQLRWDQIVQNLWYTVEGILGVPVGVSVRFIYIFILFGAFLEMSGAGKWFIDLAYSITGTRQGGPAKASVVSSGFMGMLSGSSVANTVTTGALTIPLMKRSGYSPEFAGAVESSVSSGGQILPPVMGAAAFLIVEYTATPFREVVIAATLPALAFFFGMWVMVHFEAAKEGIGGLDRSELLDIGPHMRRGWFYLVPLGLLLYYLVIARLSVGRAGWLTIAATVALIAMVAAYNERTGPALVGSIAAGFALYVATLFTTGVTPVGLLYGETGPALSAAAALREAVASLPTIVTAISVVFLLADPRGDAPLLELDDTVEEAAAATDERLGREIANTRTGRFTAFVLKSMDNGARTATIVVVAVAAAGIIPGVIGITGLGGSLRALILDVSGGSLVLLLILAGIASVIVGMGMPTTVMYIIIVVLLGPVLPEFGIAILAVHLFVLYLGLMADVTPPVMVAAYAAAGIAKSDPFETGKTAFLLSLNKILVPFAFVFAPGILLLRSREDGDSSLITFADVADLGFFLPEVVAPVLATFAGVYALGVAIIGYYHASVSRASRAALMTAAVFLSVPGMVLLPAGTALGTFGVDVMLHTLTNDLALRGVGAVMLVAGLVRNRRRARTVADRAAGGTVGGEGTETDAGTETEPGASS
ncbi:TRAP transporter fused permease subunit [Halorubrum sp. JWXQ-INN 858]|uniref:TRAP transporter permease n=1 Tax=Halorubrum sp. JWXQ-INN 858 TaxID=2690782 RepID=UPI00135722CB|nr:TRAP transporter fused permease subunit [Halorubrum sp. JWXQ-INN 858]MWV64373.1 TRAP transporter fused permease subunit [Halorubrum sp. JWXQ-INN 858]